MVFALLVTGCVVVFGTILYLTIAPIFGHDIAAKKEAFLPLERSRFPVEEVRDVLSAIGCSIVHEEDHVVVGRLGMSLSSWGEDVLVEKVDGGMKITSRCISDTQGADWGKNRRNIARFSAEWMRRNA